MNLKLSLALVLGITCTTPLVSVSQESTTTAPPQATFPPSTKCATATPCRNVTGEVVKIEESYWIQFPNGQQTHIRVKPDTKIDSRVKVGDSIAAQLTSTGDADAVIKLSEKPQAVELPKPDKSLTDVR
jgi:hypothetical protein